MQKVQLILYSHRTEPRMFLIEEELKKLPASPGVYIMHGEKDEIIYVGKAKILKNRVRQYFQTSRNKGMKIEQMVTHITRFEYIVTDSELEALVLESNLIKEHRPKYNTMLKDDKSYPFIKVTVSEAYPRILFSRNMKKDKNRYFGPYTSAAAVKEVIELIRKLYRIRSCSRPLPADFGKQRPCLYYHMKECTAPCTGKVPQEEYLQSIQNALRFLNGDVEEVTADFTRKMQQASEDLRFEEAGEYRDLIANIRRISERQKITSFGEEDRDVIAASMDESEDLRDQDAVVQVFFIREGRMIGREHFFLRAARGDDKAQVLSSFVKQYYAGTPFIPREILLEKEVEDMDVLEEWLGVRRGQKVHILVPRKGDKERLVRLASENAAIVLSKDRERIKREEGRTIGAVREIERWLGLEDVERMEAYDISNISGFDSVGSMVVYEKGKPKRSDYRKFRIKWVEGPNDYASLEEVLTRRFTHEGSGEYDSFRRFPDLILMDGGKGQVNIAEKVLDVLGLDIPVCGMVKDDRHRTRGVYFRNREIPIDTSGEGFRLVTRIQDEAHRFAIEYHRSLRSKGQVHSVLDDIPGIGETRRKALMRRFRAIEKIRDASLEELAETESMNIASAQKVFDFFRKKEREAGNEGSSFDAARGGDGPDQSDA